MRPGYRTTEFWLSLAATLLAFVAASGLLADGGAGIKVLGIVSGVLASLGYTGGRAFVKSAEAKGAAAVEVARLGKPQ